jgi:hypothetical protein
VIASDWVACLPAYFYSQVSRWAHGQWSVHFYGVHNLCKILCAALVTQKCSVWNVHELQCWGQSYVYTCSIVTDSFGGWRPCSWSEPVYVADLGNQNLNVFDSTFSLQFTLWLSVKSHDHCILGSTYFSGGKSSEKQKHILLAWLSVWLSVCMTNWCNLYHSCSVEHHWLNNTLFFCFSFCFGFFWVFINNLWPRSVSEWGLHWMIIWKQAWVGGAMFIGGTILASKYLCSALLSLFFYTYIFSFK